MFLWNNKNALKSDCANSWITEYTKNLWITHLEWINCMRGKKQTAISSIAARKWILPTTIKLGKWPWTSGGTPVLADTLFVVLWDPEQKIQWSKWYPDSNLQKLWDIKWVLFYPTKFVGICYPAVDNEYTSTFGLSEYLLLEPSCHPVRSPSHREKPCLCC